MSLLFFFGTECSHCHKMDPSVSQLEKEEKVKVERIEVWHNEQNAEKLRMLDDGKCGGVPFFYNEKTKKWICGEASYEDLKKWATE